LGEIRVAAAMGDEKEAMRLRKLHINGFKFALLPLLEKVIIGFENDRTKYPDFKSFLPEICKALHNLKPSDVDEMLLSSRA
jgi:hypothetical protein